jgi:Holliday junction resolvase RusA-like endonuclease
LKTGQVIRRGVTPEKTANYETLVKQLFAVAYPGFMPLEGPLSLSIEAFLLIPASVSQKKQAAMEAGEILPEKRPDVDNLMKTVADALQGMAFRNDSQIAEARIQKRWGRVPGMRVVLKQMGGPEPGPIACGGRWERLGWQQGGAVTHE